MIVITYVHARRFRKVQYKSLVRFYVLTSGVYKILFLKGMLLARWQ